MKRYLSAYLLALVGVLFPVLPAQAGPPVYAGNLQVVNGATLTFLNGASGCLIAQSGVVLPMPCPVGTVAFSASSPFTVTGTGPYVIGCPTCFTTAGGTITGATTFSNPVTFNGAVTATNNLSTSAELLSTGGSGTSCNLQGTELKNSANSGGDWFIFTGNACTYGSSLLFRWQPTSAIVLQIDSGGNATFGGQVTATQYNISSKRAYKYDIHPLPFDALQVLHDTDFACFRYKPKHGDPHLSHCGIIADDSPSVVSGEKHDHLDLEALATVDAKAILQLDQDINVLYVILASLVVIILLLGIALGVVWSEKEHT